MNKTEIPETGNYVDQQGRVWFCVAKPKDSWMVCISEGHYTVAGFDTFARWGWRNAPAVTSTDRCKG